MKKIDLACGLDVGALVGDGDGQRSLTRANRASRVKTVRFARTFFFNYNSGGGAQHARGWGFMWERAAGKKGYWGIVVWATVWSGRRSLSVAEVFDGAVAKALALLGLVAEVALGECGRVGLGLFAPRREERLRLQTGLRLLDQARVRHRLVAARRKRHLHVRRVARHFNHRRRGALVHDRDCAPSQLQAL